jgi:hypothetical protein
MAKKMTKRDYFNRILSYAHEEDKEFLENELDLLDKKNAAGRKPSAKLIAKRNADADLRAAIVTEMEMGVKYTAADMVKALPTLAAVEDMTAAKVSYLMRDLIVDGSVVKGVEKRRTYYWLSE